MLKEVGNTNRILAKISRAVDSGKPPTGKANIDLNPPGIANNRVFGRGKGLKIEKGTTPASVLSRLQKDFVTQGLDAYNNFKLMGGMIGGLGIDHSEQTG